ncbi:MAG: hypothetical protein WA485_12835, partial [Candidatus Sulfotelmatobacter sp.]
MLAPFSGPWLVGTTKVYPGPGADIVMESMRRGEGNPVVGADRSGQAAFVEQALKGGEREIFAIGFQRFTQ